jgi:hypothetical protein
MKRILVFVFIICSALQGTAQQFFTSPEGGKENNVETLLNLQKDYLFNVYYQRVGGVDELKNGREYIPYYPHSRLKPLLYVDKSRVASLLLNGRKYENLTLEYDTYSDAVIYHDTTKLINNRYYQIAINKDPIGFFTLYFESDSLLFRYLQFNDMNDAKLQSGFYEIAYEGKSRYIIKHKSVVHEKDGVDEYYYSPRRYVMVGNKYFRIRSTRRFLKLFGEKTDQIRNFTQSSHINIKNADKRQIVNIMKYYDTLIP